MARKKKEENTGVESTTEINSSKEKKCSKCGKVCKIEELVPIGEHQEGVDIGSIKEVYCQDCWSKYGKARNREIKIRKQLNDYLYELANHDQYAMILFLSQIKKLQNFTAKEGKHKYKDSGILLTLKYAFELSNVRPKIDPNIGIYGLILKYYPIAMRFYQDCKDTVYLSKEEIDELYARESVEVHIKRSTLEERDRKHTEKLKDWEYGPKIDLDSIEDE